eukprot:scaffold361585_cov18-Prasinocladus_malaysianus.AAC.1
MQQGAAHTWSPGMARDILALAKRSESDVRRMHHRRAGCHIHMEDDGLRKRQSHPKSIYLFVKE